MCKWGWYTTDDDGNIVGKTDVDEETGRVDVYDATDGDFDMGHGHDVYSSMDAYDDSVCDQFAGNESGGDIYSRDPDDEDSYGRDWEDRGWDDD